MIPVAKFKLLTRNVVMRMAAQLCRLLGPKFAARLTARSIRYIPGSSGINMLVMMRASFDKDIAALAKHTGLGFVVVHNGYVRFQEVFLPRDRREQTYYQSAAKPFSGAQDPQAIYAAELLDQARAHAPIAGVLSANVDYWQDVGLKFHCQQQNLVFGVLCRENAVIPRIVDVNFRRYNEAGYRFEGDFVVMAGKTSARMMQDAGIAPADRILAIGLPRYDVWHDARPLGVRNFITLLTFTRGYGANTTFQEVLDAFVHTAAATTDPSLTFLIKTKDADDTRHLRDLLQGRITSNIRIDDTILMTEALSGSRVIVGYNSLSLIDALLSGARIILPGFGECLTSGDMCMYPQTKHSAAFFAYADTVDDLSAALSAAAVAIDDNSRTILSRELLHYIQQYVSYTPDELNSTAFETILTDHVRLKQPMKPLA